MPKWKCTQTFIQCGHEPIVVKEFYKFDGDIPLDRIIIKFHTSLAPNEKDIISCLDVLMNNWLTMCYIDNFGHTCSILQSITKDKYGTHLHFGKSF